MNVKVKIDGQTFEVEVGDLSTRPILVKVDGEFFEIWPEEEAGAAPAGESVAMVQPGSAPVGPAPANGQKRRVVSAPIPGAIVSIAVQPGDRVSIGQELCGLEAMKMKNAIRATRAGQIATVLVSVGDLVQKGHPLVEFSD